jgi:hypothetical protein
MNIFTGGKDRLSVVTMITEQRQRDTDAGRKSYHWGIVSAPKNGDFRRAVLYHVRNVIDGGVVVWKFERKPLQDGATTKMLTGVIFAKIINKQQVEQILASVPMVQNDPNWTCRSWVNDAIAALEGSGAISGAPAGGFAPVEAEARTFTGEMVEQQRFTENGGPNDTRQRPLYDMLQGKQLT